MFAEANNIYSLNLTKKNCAKKTYQDFVANSKDFFNCRETIHETVFNKIKHDKDFNFEDNLNILTLSYYHRTQDELGKSIYFLESIDAEKGYKEIVLLEKIKNYWLLGRYEEVTNQINELKKVDAEIAQAVLGQVNFYNMKMSESISGLLASNKYGLQLPQHELMLSKAYEKTKNYAMSAQHFSKYISKNKLQKKELPQQRLAELYELAGDIKRSKKIYEKFPRAITSLKKPVEKTKDNEKEAGSEQAQVEVSSTEAGSEEVPQDKKNEVQK